MVFILSRRTTSRLPCKSVAIHRPRTRLRQTGAACFALLHSIFAWRDTELVPKRSAKMREVIESPSESDLSNRAATFGTQIVRAFLQPLPKQKLAKCLAAVFQQSVNIANRNAEMFGCLRRCQCRICRMRSDVIDQGKSELIAQCPPCSVPLAIGYAENQRNQFHQMVGDGKGRGGVEMLGIHRNR